MTNTVKYFKNVAERKRTSSGQRRCKNKRKTDLKENPQKQEYGIKDHVLISIQI